MKVDILGVDIIFWGSRNLEFIGFFSNFGLILAFNVENCSILRLSG